MYNNTYFLMFGLDNTKLGKGKKIVSLSKMNTLTLFIWCEGIFTYIMIW